MSEVNDIVFRHVDGWVGDKIVDIVEFIDEFHNAHAIHGDVAEIGVHHGKLFFILSSIAKETEKCIAIDLYENQSLNLDNSGSGSREIFERHIKELFPEMQNRIKIVPADSMSLTPSQLRETIGTAGVRVFSVDGGHNIEHVVNDLSLAQEVLVGGGIVMLDDFFGPHWPSVTEGYFKFMRIANRRLAPFLIYQNKIFLTTYSERDHVEQSLKNFIIKKFGAEAHKGNWKGATISGVGCLAYS
ncbi:class I SAM-dependent methyltransferase [Methylorubrum extorquens]|uniref:class I SAM-dependent methyltransferase n=1 Tax=Methylorubrum extorquens TaxID=408 RepID=UPI003F5D79A4